MDFMVGLSLILLSLSVLITTLLVSGLCLYVIHNWFSEPVKDEFKECKPSEAVAETTVYPDVPATDAYTDLTNGRSVPLESFTPDLTKPVKVKFKTEANGVETMEVS